MNFDDTIGLDEIEKMGSWENFQNPDDLEKLINLIKQFESYDKFTKFIQIIKSIPIVKQITELTHTNTNLFFFKFLKSSGYFNLLDPIQKYHLFVEACSYDSIDIAMLIFSTSIDLEGVKEFMQNYLSQVATCTEYLIFRKIWEKNIIQFNQEEIEEMFFQILDSLNIEFIEWFCYRNLIDLKDTRIKEKIGNQILENEETTSDFQVAKFFSSMYLKIYKNEK
jgi:hypothetical protein